MLVYEGFLGMFSLGNVKNYKRKGTIFSGDDWLTLIKHWLNLNVWYAVDLNKFYKNEIV